MKKQLVTGDSSPSLQKKNDSQLLSLLLPSSLLSSVAPVASNNADNDSDPSLSGGDWSNTTTRHSKTKKHSRWSRRYKVQDSNHYQ